MATSSSGAGPPAAVDISLGFSSGPTLRVATLHSSGTGLAILQTSVGGGSGAPITPAQVTVDLAAGYTVPAAGAGSPVGIATVGDISTTKTGATLAFITGSLTADDPARYANDPAAQACAPGPYTAVWKLVSDVFGLTYSLTVFVEHPAGNTQRVELRFCPPPLTDATGKPVTPAPMPLADADFLLVGAGGPTARGSYTSSALVTPFGASGGPDTASTVEARSVEPVPHTLTLKGRYDAKTHDAVLTGRVTESGKPQARAVVEYFRLDELAQPKHVRTSAAGTFTARVRITGTTTFAADVPDTNGPCPGSSPAPQGCANLTVVGSNDQVVRVTVPRR